jgi:hypothetical protein
VDGAGSAGVSGPGVSGGDGAVEVETDCLRLLDVRVGAGTAPAAPEADADAGAAGVAVDVEGVDVEMSCEGALAV